MTISNDVVLWDNGIDKFFLYPVPKEQQYKYIDDIPCLTFGIAYENYNYKGYDTFTLFDHFYSDVLNAIDQTYRTLNGAFRINDVGADTDGYIDFEMKNCKLYIKGRLGASFSSHSLKFEFEADQTMVGILLEALAV